MEERVLIDEEWAVLDAVGADQAVLAGVCTGAGHALLMAAEAPERVLGVCAINPGLRLTTPLPHRVAYDFDEPRATYEGWAEAEPSPLAGRTGATSRRSSSREMFPEPHSTKQREDCVEWAMAVGAARRCCCEYGAARGIAGDPDAAAAACRRRAVPGARHHRLATTAASTPTAEPIVADLTGGDHVVIEGGGHLPQARDPVQGQPAAARLPPPSAPGEPLRSAESELPCRSLARPVK